MKQFISLFLVLLCGSVSSSLAQWRIFNAKGVVKAIVEAPHGQHVILTEGKSICSTFGGLNYGCQFDMAYMQRGVDLDIVLDLQAYGGNEYERGHSLRSVQANAHGVVAMFNFLTDISGIVRVYRLPVGDSEFREAFQSRPELFVYRVCRDASILALDNNGRQQRIFNIFTEDTSHAAIRFPSSRQDVETGYITIPPSDSVPYWRVSEDCGQDAVPYRIPGDSIVRIDTWMEPHQMATTASGKRYVTYDRALSWLEVPSLPIAYTGTGYTVQLEHFTNDSVMVANLRKDGSNLLVYCPLNGDTWRELPAPPFPSLTYIGGSLQALYVARNPFYTSMRTTDSIQPILALLDPTVGVTESAVPHVEAKRIVHRGDRLSFSEDVEWMLYGIDGSIAGHGHSASIPFDVPPGIYFLSKPGMQMMVAVIP